FNVASGVTGVPVISIPFANFTPGAPPAEAVLQLAAPNVSTGAVEFTDTSRLWGAEANLICDGHFCCAQLLLGYRYLSFEDQFDLTGFQGPLGTVPAPPLFNDHFSTHNVFNGGQIGLRFHGCCLETTLKFACGDNHQTFVTAGTNTVGLAPGATQPTGVFAE